MRSYKQKTAYAKVLKIQSTPICMKLKKHCKDDIFIVLSTRINRDDPYKVIDVISNGSSKSVELELRSFVSLTP